MKKLFGAVMLLVLLTVSEAWAATESIEMYMPAGIYIGNERGDMINDIKRTSGGSYYKLYVWGREPWSYRTAGYYDLENIGEGLPGTLLTITYEGNVQGSTHYEELAIPPVSTAQLIGAFDVNISQTSNTVGTGSIVATLTPVNWGSNFEMISNQVEVVEIYPEDLGGGSCNSFGLGALFLGIPAAFMFVRKRR